MWAALAAVLAHPSWWTIALAGFLLRGGIVLVALPIMTLPTTAGLTTALAPTLEAIYLGRPSLEGAVIAIAVIFTVLGGLTAAGLTGSWFDLALVREAARDDDVDLGWAPRSASVVQALAIRLTTHIPTTVAIAYGLVRLVTVAYDELTSPSTADDPVAVRVLVRAPDAVLVVLLAWLVGEVVGALASRRAWAGESAPRALLAAFRQVLGRRGLATLGLTTAIVAGALLVFVLAAERAWEHLRARLLESAPPDQVAAAVVLLAVAWALGLAVLGAALAWRATAWTAEVRPT